MSCKKCVFWLHNIFEEKIRNKFTMKIEDPDLIIYGFLPDSAEFLGLNARVSDPYSFDTDMDPDPAF
jgi:hypothetical protein